MSRKTKIIIIILITVVISAGASVFSMLYFFWPDEIFTPSEYAQYQRYKDLDQKGLILEPEEADYLFAVSYYFKDLFGALNIVQNSFYKDTRGIDFTLGAAKGMIEMLDDPYSYFLSIDEFTRLKESYGSAYVGIGVVVTPADDGYITVVSPFKDSPAEKAGIKPLDRIVAVNGERVSGDQLSRAVELIRGVSGTEVSVTFQRDNVEFELVLVRETITVETVYSELLEDDIGYIGISQFASNTAKEFEENLESLLDENINGLIIDLRYNPGGDLDTLVDIADMLLGEQTVISLVNKQGKATVYESGKNRRYDGPMVILVNNGSASASEALTGAIKDTGNGVVVGTRTFGKGVAQTLYPLEGGYALNITTAEYFTPNGTNVNETGIDPDHVIEDDPETPEDEQLDKAIEVLKEIR